jgi:ATP-dependent RNA circularization protein (DNA/RNA ligase family)
LFVFDIFDIETGTYLPMSDKLALIEQLGLVSVPIIDSDFAITEDTTIDDILSYADGTSVLYDTKREGVVFMSKDRKTSFKSVSNLYLLG